MFKVQEFSITGFWGKYEAKSSFHEDVNIVIGRNGSGKTTFMNILHAVLSADIEALYENDFRVATVKLTNGKSTRTIRVEKPEDERSLFSRAEYQISTRKYVLPIYGGDEARNFPMSARRRAFEELETIRTELASIVALASLSVYRISSESDPEQRERPSKRLLSPVDYHLARLAQKLTHYQLELSNEARLVSADLQREVLASLLYQKETAAATRGSILEFNEDAEKISLASAYKQLGIIGPDIAKRINEHTGAIAEAVLKLKQAIEQKSAKMGSVDLTPIEARKRATKVIDLSLKAEKQNKEIFAQVELFKTTLKRFIDDKTFDFVAGDLQVTGTEPLPLAKLSSGEKQLLILFIEALLQRQKPYVFLADEPELSLHISWQRNIIPAIRELNPNAQVIVATHSPEIAGRFKPRIVDMGAILHV